MGIDENIREIQKGILKWYPFKEGAKCLYVGEKTDAVFEMLCEAMDVDFIRPEDVAQNETISDAISMVNVKYDYIIAIESLEILSEVAAALKSLSEMLKQDGHMLLGFNNRFGTRYFFGDRDPYTKNLFDGIEDYFRAYNKKEDAFLGRCYDKQTLMDIFDDCGLAHQNFSVFPDLKNVQILLRDDYESNEDFSIRVLPTYHHADTVFLQEEQMYNALQKNHMLHSMANAFLFDCTFESDGLDVLQVTSSMGRSKEDSFFTMIHGNAVGETVEKLPAYPEGVKKLHRMQKIADDLRDHGIETVDMELKDDGSLTMPYVTAPTAQAYLKELALKDEDAFVEKLGEFVNLIRSSSNHVSEDAGDGEGILLEKGYPDLVPLNAFYVDGKFVFFDQEFAIENYPANMTIWRAVSSMGPAVAKCEKYTMEDLYKRYGIFEKLSKWQAMEWDFISKLRKEKEMAPYYSKIRYDGNKVYSNRLRMNFSAEEYMQKFVNLFKGLENKKVIVFGSGQFAKQFMQMYGGDYDVAAVIDNRKDKHGEKFYGVKIYGAEILKDFEPGSYRVIVCIKNFLSVMNQLEELGVKDYGIFDPSQQYVRERRSSASVTSGEGQAALSGEDQPKKKYHIGYIAGVFDLFHVGHLEKFKLAKEQCDYLIVGLVTDEGVRLYKKTEPFVPFEDRKAMLEACKYVDEVVKIPPNFGGTRDAWKMYGFDVQFSGSDYANDPSWEAEKQFLEDHGVDMVFFPYTESTSSSKLKALIDQKLL